MLPFAVEGWQLQCEEIAVDRILDIRPVEGFLRAHLEGAESVPYTDFQDDVEGLLEAGQAVLVVDSGGARAAEMAMWLKQRGHDAAYLKGGMSGWSGELA